MDGLWRHLSDLSDEEASRAYRHSSPLEPYTIEALYMLGCTRYLHWQAAFNDNTS